MPTNPMQLLTSSIVACGNALVREAAELFRPLGVTVPQFNVLQLLDGASDGLRPSVLAGSLVVDPANATYVINQMERRAWVSRRDEPNDRRAYRVLITDAGRIIHQEVSEVYQRALDRLYKSVQVDRMDEVVKLMREIPQAAAVAGGVAAAGIRGSIPQRPLQRVPGTRRPKGSRK